MPQKGGVEGEFDGILYPFVVGLKEGPRRLHLCGSGTISRVDGDNLVVEEPSGVPGKPNTLTIPLSNVAFMAENFFLVSDPPKDK